MEQPIITAGASWMRHFARRHAEAADLARAALAIEPEFLIAHSRLAIALKHLGDYPQAMAETERWRQLSGDAPDVLAQLGMLSAMQGRREPARRVIEQLRALSAARYVSPVNFAIVYAALGERDSAFEWLARAADEGYGQLVYVNVDPELDALRTDPRFATLAARVKTGAPGESRPK